MSFVQVNDKPPKRNLPDSYFIKLRGQLGFGMSLLTLANYELYQLTQCENSDPKIAVKIMEGARRRQTVWIYHKQADPNRKTLVFYHGGGYFFGAASEYVGLFSHMARKYNMNIYLPEYGLAPENDYRYIFPDAIAELKHAIEHFEWDMDKVVVGGDSAGGNLVLNLMRILSRDDVELFDRIKSVILVSPWCDLSCSTPSATESDNRNEIILSKNLVFTCKENNVPFTSDPVEFSVTNWDYDTLITIFHNKRVYINYGDRERLSDEIYDLVDKVERIVDKNRLVMKDFIVDVGKGMCHDYSILFYHYIPESNQSLDNMANFINKLY